LAFTRRVPCKRKLGAQTLPVASKYNQNKTFRTHAQRYRTIIHKIGITEHDRDGRVLAAEFEHFFLLNVYVPNSGEELAN